MSKKAVAEPGTIVGEKYRIVRTIGTGGMGVVYEARHIELGQRVALKVLQNVEDEEQVVRFLREARASVRLKSDHAAKVIDVGRPKSGAPYMVMELLSGKDLAELCTFDPLPPAVAVSYVLQACEAVAEAHALGIVHRDLKPSNLFLTERPDGQPLVKVLDFGIAKMSRHEENDKLTGTGAVMGSPRYMSPEQLRSSRDVDARTDIWSLGVCLYELMSRHTPFEAPSAPELYVLVLRDEPTPILRWLPDLPPGLAAAISRCLEKDPARRFTSVSELATALEPFALGEARTSAARISRVLAKTGHSEPPAAIEQAIARAETAQLETVVLPDRQRGGSSWLLVGVFAAVTLAAVGGGVVFLSRTSRDRTAPTATPPPTVEPALSAVPEPSASNALEPVPVPASASASAALPRPSAPRPTSRPSVAGPAPAPRPPSPQPAGSSPAGFKTKFE